ncbi:hypothetical protein P7C70_g9390, partial [Phenoliferia sp. Uapishka_3]
MTQTQAIPGSSQSRRLSSPVTNDYSKQRAHISPMTQGSSARKSVVTYGKKTRGAKGVGMGKGKQREVEEVEDFVVDDQESTVGIEALRRSLELEEKRAKKTKVDDSEDEDEMEQGEEEVPALTPADLKKLDDISQCQDWNKCTIEGVDGDVGSTLELRVKDAVILSGGDDWVGEVQLVRSFQSDLSPLLAEDGTPLFNKAGKARMTCNDIYIQNRWFYTAQQLKELNKDE